MIARWLAFRPLPMISASVSVGLIATCISWVDLSPRVDASFFFSGTSGAMREDARISELFPSHEQLVVSAIGSIETAGYMKRVASLSGALLDLPHVRGVQSLATGPKDFEDASDSPLWSRLLLPPDRESSILLLIVDSGDSESLIRSIEGVLDRHAASNFELVLAGPLYVSELIRRGLTDDLIVFSVAAFGIFSLVILAVFRSLPIAAGAALSGLSSVAATLMIQQLLEIPPGVLTANLAVVVFVLSQTHAVFLSSNAQSAGDAALAVRRSFVPSSWSMATTLLGFLSLLLVDAEPLRQLGLAGAVGTAVALVVTYASHPPFVAWQLRRRPRSSASEVMPDWPSRRRPRLAFGVVLAVVLVGAGLPWLRLDPSLLDYFDEDGVIHDGLAYIDARGGSSLLNLVVRDAKGESLADSRNYERMWRLQERLSSSSEVGVVISLPVLMAEGDRHPLSFLVSWESMLDLMRTERYERVAKSFVSNDNQRALFMLRMREEEREKPRLEVVEGLEEMVRQEGFETVLAGGIYALQGHLAEQVRSSVLEGVALLTALFAVMGYLVSRSFRVAAAMTAGIALIPLALMGLLGGLRVPIDIICAPGVNVAMGMAVDSMVHLVLSVRRQRHGDGSGWAAWSHALREQGRAIVTSTLIVALGFGLFGLSSFPPTQRLGLVIGGGSLLAAAVALLVLPVLACPAEQESPSASPVAES